jgi:hypothetical protein
MPLLSQTATGAGLGSHTPQKPALTGGSSQTSEPEPDASRTHRGSAGTMDAVSASLVYLLLRQVLQILTSSPATAAPRTSNCWCYAIRSRSCADRYTGRLLNLPAAWCWPVDIP